MSKTRKTSWLNPALFLSVVSVFASSCSAYYAYRSTRASEMALENVRNTAVKVELIEVQEYLDAVKDLVSGSAATGSFSEYRGKKRDLVRADRLLKKAEKLKPNDASVLHRRGQYYSAKDQEDIAVTYFLRALRVDSRHVESHVSLSRSYVLQKNYDEAIKLCTDGLWVDPQSPDLLSNRGISHYRSGSYQKALADFEAVLQIDSTQHQYLNNLAMVKRKMGEQEEAATLYLRALEEKPDYERAQSALCEIYQSGTGPVTQDSLEHWCK